MSASWEENIRLARDLVAANDGAQLAAFVSGGPRDAEFWRHYSRRTIMDVFSADGTTALLSIQEATPKGNFLGTLNAWRTIAEELSTSASPRPNMMLISMVFGKGKRFSPFTQALGNRKAALPTPMLGRQSHDYLRSADLSNLYTNSWLSLLDRSGFRGVVIKWGDEAIIPGVAWHAYQQDYSDIDAVRFVWNTPPTPTLAREKDWIAFDPTSGLMTSMYQRQPVESLRAAMRSAGRDQDELAVNLGSLAVTYDFLDACLRGFAREVDDPTALADWDPYTWMALLCPDTQAWDDLRRSENRIGKTGIRDLEAKIPSFFSRMQAIRVAYESQKRRPLRVGVLDFGETLWADMGLHTSMREFYESLLADSAQGRASRLLLDIPETVDADGNIIVRSALPPTAKIRESVIVDTVITDPRSVIRRGVVIGGRHKLLKMAAGGAALFCAADSMRYFGPRGIAFRSIGETIDLDEGARHTTLHLEEQMIHLVSNEDIVDYSGHNYTRAVCGNAVSFEAAGELMEAQDGIAVELAWGAAWRDWLGKAR